MHAATFLPALIRFDAITLDAVNDSLVAWGHRMGPLNRPYRQGPFHGLFHEDRLVGVVAAASLVRETCAGFGRHEALELARVCAARPDLCRVLVRLWREFVFPVLRQPWAVSYQDAVMHSGNLYRFDGWVPVGTSRSGTDQRGGRKGRSKVIWGWHADADARAARRMAA